MTRTFVVQRTVRAHTYRNTQQSPPTHTHRNMQSSQPHHNIMQNTYMTRTFVVQRTVRAHTYRNTQQSPPTHTRIATCSLPNHVWEHLVFPTYEWGVQAPGGEEGIRHNLVNKFIIIVSNLTLIYCLCFIFPQEQWQVHHPSQTNI